MQELVAALQQPQEYDHELALASCSRASLFFDPNPERERLAFKDAVLFRFKFLGDLGFRPVEQEMTFVRYESAGVFVNVLSWARFVRAGSGNRHAQRTEQRTDSV